MASDSGPSAAAAAAGAVVGIMLVAVVAVLLVRRGRRKRNVTIERPLTANPLYAGGPKPMNSDAYFDAEFVQPKTNTWTNTEGEAPQPVYHIPMDPTDSADYEAATPDAEHTAGVLVSNDYQALQPHAVYSAYTVLDGPHTVYAVAAGPQTADVTYAIPVAPGESQYGTTAPAPPSTDLSAILQNLQQSEVARKKKKKKGKMTMMMKLNEQER